MPLPLLAGPLPVFIAVSDKTPKTHTYQLEPELAAVFPRQPLPAELCQACAEKSRSSRSTLRHRQVRTADAVASPRSPAGQHQQPTAHSRLHSVSSGRACRVSRGNRQPTEGLLLLQRAGMGLTAPAD